MLRAGRFFIVTLLLVMLLAGRSGNPYVIGLKERISDALVPIISFASAPVEAIKNINSTITSWAVAHRQNQELKNQVSMLLQWQAQAKELQAENNRLRSLLNVVPSRPASFVTANIVSDHGSAFSNAALIDAGKASGIAADQAAISERALVGRVVSVGEYSAQILLVTDATSRIPVMNERTREKMILAGNGSNRPSLSYVAANSPTQKGDRIITSGDGGIFPKNIEVGLVAEIDKTIMAVDLFANIADIEMVSVVDR